MLRGIKTTVPIEDKKRLCFDSVDMRDTGITKNGN